MWIGIPWVYFSALSMEWFFFWPWIINAVFLSRHWRSHSNCALHNLSNKWTGLLRPTISTVNIFQHVLLCGNSCAWWWCRVCVFSSCYLANKIFILSISFTVIASFSLRLWDDFYYLLSLYDINTCPDWCKWPKREREERKIVFVGIAISNLLSVREVTI